MAQSELLKQVVSVLESLGAEYMLTGSHASSMQGAPRSTHDIDLVLLIDPGMAGKLASAFPRPEYYLDESSIAEAIKRKGQFNLLEIQTGDKVDFWMLTDDPFDQMRFSRRYLEAPDGYPIHVSRPEDTILMKLRWADMSGGSEKQFNDARSVYEVQRGSIDLRYIDHWAKILNVVVSWERIQREATAH